MIKRLGNIDDNRQRLCLPMPSADHWRTRSPRNPARVGGGRWHCGLAAWTRLYGWAVSVGVMARSPVVTRAVRGRFGGQVHVAEARSAHARTSNAHWLTPRAFQLWVAALQSGSVLAVTSLCCELAAVSPCPGAEALSGAIEEARAWLEQQAKARRNLFDQLQQAAQVHGTVQVRAMLAQAEVSAGADRSKEEDSHPGCGHVPGGTEAEGRLGAPGRGCPRARTEDLPQPHLPSRHAAAAAPGPIRPGRPPPRAGSPERPAAPGRLPAHEVSPAHPGR
ncbi:hypothetical protein [Streptomyces sp. HC307]|uniref:hypothetical protein n=1 Tax=Streptomyces flavusporus TaxID=3385496 RepID=UPI0039170C19